MAEKNNSTEAPTVAEPTVETPPATEQPAEQGRVADLEAQLAAANAHLIESVPAHLRDLVPNTTVAERIAWINKAKTAGLFATAVPSTDNAKVRLTPGPEALAQLPAVARIAAGYQ